MTLFVVRHEHSEERCPAKDPYLGAQMLNYLSRPNSREHGIEIQGEAVVKGKHTMYLIADAVDEQHLREFLAPFERAGSVEVYPATTCAHVVTGHGCATQPEPTPPNVLDPEQACQDAIEAGLIVHRADPLNAETSISELVGGVVMPTARFYIRDHFPTPVIDVEKYRLRVSGLVERALSLTLRDLQNLHAKTRTVTLECAGNGRTFFQPPIAGEPWHLGAVSSAEWTGVPLGEVLDWAGVSNAATEVIFRGADSGTVDDHTGDVRFERSLSIEHARESDVLLAYAMNGEPLPIQHGFPLRLIVPGWYAVASVKWLTDIELIDRHFTGVFQTEKYQYEWVRDGHIVREPVTLQNVRALITEPAPNAEIPRGDLVIRGVAWSGAAPIARVEVGIGPEKAQGAILLGARKRCSWHRWEVITHVEEAGSYLLRARATDQASRAQPDEAEWNRHGYGNNAVHEVPIRVV